MQITFVLLPFRPYFFWNLNINGKISGRHSTQIPLLFFNFRADSFIINNESKVETDDNARRSNIKTFKLISRF